MLRYISRTRNYGILFDRTLGIEVQGYSDSDWPRKSTSVYVFTIAGGSVSWKSKKKSVADISSCEAEYIAALPAAQEAFWQSQLVSVIRGLFSPELIVIKVDKNGATGKLESHRSISETST